MAAPTCVNRNKNVLFTQPGTVFLSVSFRFTNIANVTSNKMLVVCQKFLFALITFDF